MTIYDITQFVIRMETAYNNGRIHWDTLKLCYIVASDNYNNHAAQVIAAYYERLAAEM